MHDRQHISSRLHPTGRIPSLPFLAATTALLSALLLCGCASHGNGPANSETSLAQQAQVFEDIKTIREELRSLKSAQEESPEQPLQESISRITDRLNELERRVAALEKSFDAERGTWDKKMKAVIEVVKSENAQLRGAIEKRYAPPGSRGVEHTVSPGDTIADIAKKYGVRAKDIIEANGLKDANRITAGQKLIIPRPSR
jgi:nucleoid-associated protein YgaU